MMSKQRTDFTSFMIGCKEYIAEKLNGTLVYGQLSATDLSQNTASAAPFAVHFSDPDAPVAGCATGYNVDLDSTGKATLDAASFGASSTDVCIV